MTEVPAIEAGIDPALWTPVEVRVCYGEVDRMGFAYYGNYLRWFEMGRGQYLRVRGRPYREIEEQGLAMPVIEACVRYRRPARYDDLIEVRTAFCARSGGASLESGAARATRDRVRVRFEYQVLRAEDGERLAEGHTIHACTGKSGRPRRFPDDLLQLLGQPPLSAA